MNRFAYLFAVLRMIARSSLGRPVALLVTTVWEFAENLLFFGFWAVFMGQVHNIGGWDIHDFALFQGVMSIGKNLKYAFGQGLYYLIQVVRTGELDTYLARPRPVLGQVMIRTASTGSNSAPAGILWGLFLLATFGQLSAAGLVMAVLSGAGVATLIVALNILFDSLVFYLSSDGVSEVLFGTLLTISNIPQHTQHGVVKFLLYTVLPAGFIAVTPVEVVRNESVPLLGLLAVAAAGYMALALWVFQRGLRRYTSATGWSA